jgi:hypothetical protein
MIEVEPARRLTDSDGVRHHLDRVREKLETILIYLGGLALLTGLVALVTHATS